MSVDHYIFNDMRQILINNIKMNINIYSADMMSSDIVNLTILVEVQNVKTFYQKIANNGAQQFHQYQQHEELPLTSNH